MKTKSKTLYYAVQPHGQGVIYTDRPSRSKKFGCWIGHIEGCYCSAVMDMEAEGLIELPNLKYDDDPVELKLTLEHG